MRQRWTSAEERVLRAIYPDAPTREVAAELGRKVGPVYQHAHLLGLHKSAAYLAGPHACRLRRDGGAGHAHRFPKGNVPWNKGVHWDSGGRSHETRFRKGSVPPNRQLVGTLRMNADGYVDMKVTDCLRGWRPFHVVLWEDAHGPIPKGCAVCFRDRDVLNLELGNFELVSRADLMRRNSVHNLPPPLKSTIHVLGQLKRRIRERVEKEAA